MHWLRLFFILPYAITVSYPFALLTRLFFGGSLKWHDKIVLSNEFPADGWFARGPYKRWGGTTLGVGIMFKHPKRSSERTFKHEMHHVAQALAAAIAGFIQGVAVLIFSGDWKLAIFVWWLAPILIFVGGWIDALLRGEPAYRGSFHEVGAYAVGDQYER